MFWTKPLCSGKKGVNTVKKNILKRVIVSILSLSLVIGVYSPTLAASHAENGADVIPNNLQWSSFSICTGEDGGSWEDSLKKVYRTIGDGSYFYDENGNKVTFVKGVDYATEGFINGDYDNKSDEVTFYCHNTGWDGEYASMTRGGPSVLVSDNPWGMTLTMDGIPVEFGRYYTMEFDLAGDLNEAKYDANENKTTYVPASKHILLKAYDFNSSGGPSAAFERVEQDGKELSKDGFILVEKTEKGKDIKYSHIVAKFKIPDTPEEWGGGRSRGSYTQMGIKFALGANLVTYKNESGMRGNIYVRNMKVLAGTQHVVRYYDGNTLKQSKYVNDEESANSVKLTKKGYSLSGYSDKSTGKKYDFSTILTGNVDLKAIWSKTPAAGKTTIKLKSKNKKTVNVKFGSTTNIRGYQIMHSYNSKFNKKSKYKTKTKTTSRTSSYTISSLKSESVVYVKARGYNLDSTGSKVYGPWSSRQVAYVR